MRQTKSLYLSVHTIIKKFTKCSDDVKSTVFTTFCCSFYCGHLWSLYLRKTYAKLRTAYNNAFRALFKIPRWVSVSTRQVECNVNTFHALLRKHSFAFLRRCMSSENVFVNTLFNSQVLFDSGFWQFLRSRLMR